MKNRSIGLAVILVIILAGGYYLLLGNKNNKSSEVYPKEIAITDVQKAEFNKLIDVFVNGTALTKAEVSNGFTENSMVEFAILNVDPNSNEFKSKLISSKEKPYFSTTTETTYLYVPESVVTEEVNKYFGVKNVNLQNYKRYHKNLKAFELVNGLGGLPYGYNVKKLVKENDQNSYTLYADVLNPTDAKDIVGNAQWKLKKVTENNTERYVFVNFKENITKNI